MEDEAVKNEEVVVPAVISESDIAAAEAAKDEANQAFKAKHYSAAIEGYSKAIELNPKSAVYFSNRAFAHIKLEAYGSAVADATAAVQLDPKYVKAYYRRADGNFAMGKFKLALKDFKTAAKVAPRDPDLKKKLTECEKEVNRLRFEEALATPEAVHVRASSTVDVTTMEVEESYSGPRMEVGDGGQYTVTRSFMDAMLSHFKEQRLIHKRFAFEIVLQSQALMRAQASLVDVSIPDDAVFTVCGDVHGQYYDLLRIFELNGMPSEDNPYLFNGDFVDRGSFSVEVILVLLGFKCLLPQHMHLARGNHESHAMNKIYGFDGEVRAKYPGPLLDVFRETFCVLPLAHVLNKRVLVVHGGLFSRDDVTLDELRAIDRDREPPDEGPFCEVLWSDPGAARGRQPSKRGVGLTFGPDITASFLERNKLDLLVRSHEVKEEGYEIEHNGLLITVFSAPNYCDSMGNKGAFMTFKGSEMVPRFTKFEAAPHPPVKPMMYANQMLWGM